jgi:hypothetical protein
MWALAQRQWAICGKNYPWVKKSFGKLRNLTLAATF